VKSFNEGVLQEYMRLGSLEGYMYGLFFSHPYGQFSLMAEVFWSYCGSLADLKIGFVTKLYSGFRFLSYRILWRGLL